jgi:hypothetical protein
MDFWPFAGLVVTTLGSIAIVYINQRWEFKKANLAREAAAEAAAKDAEKKEQTLSKISGSVNGQMDRALREINDLKQIVSALVKTTATNGAQVSGAMADAKQMIKEHGEGSAEPNKELPKSQ